MEAIRTLIVDDEKPARQRLRDLLAGHHDVSVVGEAASSVDAIQLIRDSQADLLFLDIQMPVLVGLK
jgi:YesN/AraC family two-component response regulator